MAKNKKSPDTLAKDMAKGLRKALDEPKGTLTNFVPDTELRKRVFRKMDQDRPGRRMEPWKEAAAHQQEKVDGQAAKIEQLEAEVAELRKSKKKRK